MARARKCSELSETVAKLALNIARDPKVNSLDDVVREIEAHFPVLNRHEVVKAINEYTRRDPVERDEIAEKLAMMKEEARTDARLTAQIAELEKHLEAGTTPEKSPPKDPKDYPPAIKELIARRDALEAKLPKSDEVSQARVRKQIERLKQQIKDGLAPTPSARVQNYSPALKQLVRIRGYLKSEFNKTDAVRAQRMLKQNARLEKLLREGVTMPAKREPEVLSHELFKIQYAQKKLRARINAEIRDMKPRSIFGKAWEGTKEVLGVPRTVMTMLDFSATLRQGGFVALGRPVLAAKSMPEMFRSTFSPLQAHQSHEQIMDLPETPQAVAAGLYLAEHEFEPKLDQREEVFQNNLVNKIWGVGHIKRASERAYVTFLNRIRIELYITLSRTMSKSGTPTFEEAQAIANYINAATGRGSLASLERHAQTMSTMLFSPRYLASRIQLIAGQPFYKGTARTRKLIAMEYARYLAGLAVLYGLANLDDDVEVEIDPRSSDFGKIKIGKTRIDPLSGLAQVSVFTSRNAARAVNLMKQATGSKKKDLIPEYKSVNGGSFRLEGNMKLGDVWGRFFKSKLAPMPGLAWTLASGENYIGQKMDEKVRILGTNEKVPRAVKEAADSLYPMVIGDIYGAMQDLDVPHATAAAVLAMFGMSVNTFDEKK